MNSSNAQSIALRLHTLTVFRNVYSDPLFSDIVLLLESANNEQSEKLELFCSLASSTYHCGGNLSKCILKLALEDDNICTKFYASGKTPPENLLICLEEELKLLEEVASLTSNELKELTDFNGFLPDWQTTAYDFVDMFKERMSNIRKYGSGIFVNNFAFRLINGTLAPVSHPDTISIEQLSGYERERSLIENNTLALLDGKPAANVLLYGESGTGKSSTVKALINKYSSCGLRLIEARKNQLNEIPDLIELLNGNPLKFIIFIDDLSFAKDDDSFAGLKAVLEGSVTAKSANVSIYATSNRRHLVKESFRDREGDEIHLADTIAEITSLSDRFGLVVTFERPGKDLYIDIVCELAKQNKIDMEKDKLAELSELYALRRGGRSPRVAKQFIDSLNCRNSRI